MSSRRAVKGNDHLRALLEEAGWTREALARAVNIVGAETGQSLHYDRTAVAHWVAGTVPRNGVTAMIAEAFGRKLGRLVTPSDTGLAAPQLGSATAAELPLTDPTLSLRELANADLDVNEHARLARSIYQVQSAQTYDWPAARETVSASARATGRARGRRVDPDHVVMARAALDLGVAYDRYFGGGSARSALVGYVAHDIADSLPSRGSTPQARELLAAAADLVCLVGFRSFDAHAHGLAQRYYHIALALAAQADDVRRYAIILRCMSYQAHYLGHHQQALALVETALAITAGHVCGHTKAFLHIQAAICHAALGNHEHANNHLRHAKDHLARSCGPPPALGSCSLAELAYLTAHVFHYQGNTSAAMLRTAIRHYPATHRRSRALALAFIAARHLDTGHVTQARTVYDRIHADYRHLRSARLTAAKTVLRQRLR